MMETAYKRDRNYLTLVFKYPVPRPDINPFDVDTPFGKPEIIAAGNVCDEADFLREQLEAHPASRPLSPQSGE